MKGHPRVGQIDILGTLCSLDEIKLTNTLVQSGSVWTRLELQNRYLHNTLMLKYCFNVRVRACIDIFGSLIVPLSLLLTVPIRNKGIFQQEFIYNPHNIKQHRLPFDDAGEGDRADQHDEPGQPDQHQRRRARELRRQLHVLVQVELRPQPHHQ